MKWLILRATLGCALWITGAAALPAADDAAVVTEPALPAFHRTFVPAEAIGGREWKHGYLPIDVKEFERLLEVIEGATSGAPRAGDANLESVQLSADLIGDDLLAGSAEMRLNRRGDGPTILALEPWNLALGSAAWQDQGERSAAIGAAPDGKLRVRAEGSHLRCNWSLHGERTAAGAVAFHFALPHCPVNRLTIEAPSGIEVTADHGVVTRSAGSGGKSNRWVIELGGRGNVTVRVLAENAARQRRQLTLLRQAVSYEFSPRGINAVAQLKLDVHGDPLERISVDLDPEVRLIAARYGELDIPWSATADIETGISHAVLQLPEPIVGTGRVLNLRAMAPIVTGKPWRLPALRPQGMSWQEGTADLLIPNGFTLEQLTTDGCRQSRISALPAPLAGESIEVQYFRPGGTIDVRLAIARQRLKLNSGTLIEVGPAEITSLVGAQLSLALGQRRAVQFDVYPGWSIDAVEDRATNRPLHWELEDATADRNTLNVRLEDPMTSSNSARLLIRGHRTVPEGG